MDIFFVIALAFGILIAFALLLPLFDKQWKAGFCKGCIAFVLTVAIGGIVVLSLQAYRRAVLIDTIQQIFEESNENSHNR